MSLIKKIQEDAEEIIRLCNTDWKDMLGKKSNYKSNPNPSDFNEKD